MSILTFNASTTNRKQLSLIECPFQIMPGGRSALTSADVEKFIETKNPDILIHSSYITRPFGKSGPVTEMNLENYVELGKRLGTKDILMHMPTSKQEYENFQRGLSLLIDLVIKKGFNIHLEITAFAKDLRSKLELCLGELPKSKLTKHMNDIVHDSCYADKGRDEEHKSPIKISMQLSDDSEEIEMKINGKALDISKPETYQELSFKIISDYIDELFGYIPEIYKKQFYFVPDTAHLYADGLDGKLQVKLMDKYKDRIKYIHLNGNISPMMCKTDKHVPIYDERNQIKETDELSKYLSSSGFICVTENSTVSGEYSEWAKYATKYGFKLVPENKLFSM